MISVLLAATALVSGPRIHAVCDISQEFTFYMDGRFHRQYIGENGVDARNWGTLWKLDLRDANLLVLAGGDDHIPYDPRSIVHIERFVREGGGLLLMANGGPLGKVAERFGAGWSAGQAKAPLAGVGPISGKGIEFKGGSVLRLTGRWEVLATDSEEKPVLARKSFGAGKVLVGSRGLFGSNPDASDPINSAWVRPLLQDLVAGKKVDPARPPKETWAELTWQVGPLTLEYHEGTKRFADAISEEYKVVREHLVEITGVQPSPGMITRLLMLPTGGGGFSSGERIAIGAWWGDYPKNRYPMIELIAHEAGHSWVLPYPEPVWNEPIATYLGIKVGQRMGMQEATSTLERAIERARAKDTDMTSVDIGKAGAPNEVVWGKTYWIFQQIESKYGGDALAKYFLAKRSLLRPGRNAYTLDDSVAVWSNAVGDDLFPWFRSLGIDVQSSRSSIGIPE